MASYTPNYNLKKPADSDYYDIADDNGNMDKIDTALNTLNANIASMNSNIVNNSVTGSSAVTTTHTIVDARLAKLGHLAILTATIDLTSNVSAWTSVFKINDVSLQASTYVFADVNNEIKEFYIGTAGDVSCTSSLTSGKEIKITIPIAVK